MHKEINQLYLNNFDDLPLFNELKNYYLKQFPEINQDIMNSEKNVQQNEKLNQLNMFIYCILIIEMSDYCDYHENGCYSLVYNDEFDGLIFEYTEEYNWDPWDKLEYQYCSDEKLEKLMKTYEPTDLTLLKKYDVKKLMKTICSKYSRAPYLRIRENVSKNIISYFESLNWNEFQNENVYQNDLKLKLKLRDFLFKNFSL